MARQSVVTIAFVYSLATRSVVRLTLITDTVARPGLPWTYFKYNTFQHSRLRAMDHWIPDGSEKLYGSGSRTTRCANDKHTEKPSRVESRLIRFGGNREIGFCWLLPLRFETEQWLFDSDRWNVSFTTRLLCHDAHAPRGHVTNDEISTAPLEPPTRQVLI